MPAEEINENVV